MPLIENDRYPRNDRTAAPVTSGDIRTMADAIRDQRINASHVQPAQRALEAAIAGGITSPLILPEGTAPTTPVSATAALYVKADGHYYSMDDGGIEYEVSRRVVAAHCRTGAGQTLLNNTVSIIDFGTITFDSRSAVTNGAAWIYTIPVAGAGSYLISALLTFLPTTAWDVGEAAELSIYRNGTRVAILDRWDSGLTAVSQRVVLKGSVLALCVVGDTLNIRASQTSGGSLALLNNASYNHMSIHRV